MTARARNTRVARYAGVVHIDCRASCLYPGIAPKIKRGGQASLKSVIRSWPRLAREKENQPALFYADQSSP